MNTIIIVQIYCMLHCPCIIQLTVGCQGKLKPVSLLFLLLKPISLLFLLLKPVYFLFPLLKATLYCSYCADILYRPCFVQPIDDGRDIGKAFFSFTVRCQGDAEVEVSMV